ncbi:MAG: acyl-CoA dehydrogenase family protein [Euryarchaeota archaeon]|nr:acyl-CoA dehydrogenase family protein [Euryarchaeota archaeon]
MEGQARPVVDARTGRAGPPTAEELGHGMRFRLTPEQRLLKKTTREFLESEVRHLVKEDKHGHGVFPEAAVKKMQEQGIFGMPIPRKYGGAGMGEVGYCLVAEEVGAVDSSLATILGAHTGIGMAPIWLFGNEDHRERIVRPLAEGTALGAFALTEPTAGSDAARIKTRADRDGDEWVLNGRKIWCSNGDRADYILVMAVSDPTLGAHGGVTAFVVEKDFPGFQVGSIEDKMGIRSSSTAELVFQDCRVPKENVIGKVGEGFIVALTALDGGRASLAAGALGACKELLGRMIDFSRKRRRAGRPIADNQAVQWKLAELAIKIFQNQHIVYDTAQLVDRYYHLIAEGHPVPRALRDEVSRKCAMVKVSASEAAGWAIEQALELFGAAGVRDAWDLERGFRDEIIIEIFEGTNEIQRLIISRDLIKGGNFW